jgi:hypothetical protein
MLVGLIGWVYTTTIGIGKLRWFFSTQTLINPFHLCLLTINVCRKNIKELSVYGQVPHQIPAWLKPVVSVQVSVCAEIQTEIRCVGRTDKKTNILFFGSCNGANDTQPICNVLVGVSAELFYIPRYVVLGWISVRQSLKLIHWACPKAKPMLGLNFWWSRDLNRWYLVWFEFRFDRILNRHFSLWLKIWLG